MNKSIIYILILIIILPFGLFIFEFLSQDITVVNIIKVIMAIFFPIPIIIFTFYLFLNLQDQSTVFTEITQETPIHAVYFLASSVLITLSILYAYEYLLQQNFAKTLLPIMLNAFILSIYVINIAIIKSMRLAGLLSGISISASLYVLFLS